MNTTSAGELFAVGESRPDGLVVALGAMPSAAAEDVHRAVQAAGGALRSMVGRLDVLYVGAAGWPQGAVPTIDAGACLLLVDSAAVAARAAALVAPAHWIRQPWPCESWMLEMSVQQAVSIARNSWLGASRHEVGSTTIGGAAEGPALAELLARIDVFEFQYDLATGRRRPSPWDLGSIGSSPTTFDDILLGVHPDDRAEVADAYARSRDSGSAYQVVFRWLQTDGSYRWREARAAVQGWTGAGTGLLRGISRDVDDALRAREATERLHRQIAHALAASRMIEWDWRGSGPRRWLTFSSHGDPTPLHGSDLDDWIHPDDRDGERVAFSTAVASGRRHEAEVRLLDPSGSWRWMRLVGDPMSDGHGSLAGYVGVGIDVSERRRLDAELSRAERSLARTLAAARAYVVEWDVATGTRTTTGPAAEILGCDPQRIDQALELIHPDDRAGAEALARRTVQDLVPYACEYRVRRSDGRLVWIHAQGAPLFSDAGDVVGTAGICLDVTANHAVEERLARLSRQCEIGLAAAGLGPWSVDLETGRYESGIGETGHFGPGIETREQLVAAVVAEDRAEFLSPFSDEFLTSQQPLAVEVRVPAADDAVRWVTVVARSVCDAQGRPREIVGISRDVTEAHRSRTLLVDAVERLDRVLEATGALLWEWRRDRGLSLRGATGTLEDDAIRVVVHPADRMRLLRQFARCIRIGAALDVEVRLQADGAWRWASVQGRRAGLADGNDVFAGMVIDINRRKRAETEQQESLLWRRAAASIVEMNLWRVDVRSGIRVGGEQDRQWYGRDVASMADFLRMVVPEDVERFDCELRAAIAQRLEFDSEVSVMSPTRGRRLLRLRAVPLDAGDSHEDVWVGATLDVTEQRRHQLELEAALSVAREASMAKSAFLAAVSHEMRTPLNAVIGYSGLLSSMQVGVEAEFHLRALRSGANQLLAVINDVLDFSRMEAGSLTLERVPFDPLTCIEGTLDLIAVAAEEKGICLSLGCDRVDWPLLFGDPTRLRQIALNLLSNAVKFTSRGAVSMSLSRVGEPGSELLTLTVEDTGIGMSEETTSRLFEPFRQGDESTSRRFGGSGLGLSITGRLVQLLNGSIEVWSALGRGSRFTVRLPWRHDETWPKRRLAVIDGVGVGVCIASAQLREVVIQQLRTFGARPVTFDAGSSFADVVATVEAVVIGARMHAHWKARADYASIDGQVAMVVLAGFADAHTLRGETESIVVASRSIKPSELNAALVQALGRRSVPDADVDRWDQGVRIPTAESGALDRMSLSILIVEDNEMNQMLLQAQLASLGYTSDLAGNGAEAIAALRTRAYDAVLMDLEMPDMDGLQTASAIRAMTDISGPQPRIIAVTAHVFAEMEARIRTAGMDDFVPKPVIIESLSAAMARVPARTA